MCSYAKLVSTHVRHLYERCRVIKPRPAKSRPFDISYPRDFANAISAGRKMDAGKEGMLVCWELISYVVEVVQDVHGCRPQSARNHPCVSGP